VNPPQGAALGVILLRPRENFLPEGCRRLSSPDDSPIMKVAGSLSPTRTVKGSPTGDCFPKGIPFPEGGDLYWFKKYLQGEVCEWTPVESPVKTREFQNQRFKPMSKNSNPWLGIPIPSQFKITP